MANIGVQLMMVKNEIGDQGMYPVLERIAELGYRSVEVSQVATDEANIAAWAGQERTGRRGGGRVGGPEEGSTNTGDALDVDFDRVVDNCRRLDCPVHPHRHDAVRRDGVEGRRGHASPSRPKKPRSFLAAEGITLAYHNHHVDFAKHDGETLFDIVRRVSPTLHFEIDVHWVQRGGRLTRWTCCASSPARSNWCT
ncbi:MAG: hypothetical protein R2742_05640 [Micropruina glycogenica]